MQTTTIEPIDHRSPPPERDACLCRAYASRPKVPKGGTLIAEDVVELGEHERMLAMDGYRPAGCRRCGANVHAHEHRARLLLGLLEDCRRETEVAIYRCADRKRCGAVWRILPALLARHLWRAWTTVEQALLVPRAPPWSEPVATTTTVPDQTRRRWRVRLATSAALVVAALGTAADVPKLAAVVERTGYEATRQEVVIIYNEIHDARDERDRLRLRPLAALVHRLVPGVRLM